MTWQSIRHFGSELEAPRRPGLWRRLVMAVRVFVGKKVVEVDDQAVVDLLREVLQGLSRIELLVMALQQASSREVERDGMAKVTLEEVRTLMAQAQQEIADTRGIGQSVRALLKKNTDMLKVLLQGAPDLSELKAGLQSMIAEQDAAQEAMAAAVLENATPEEPTDTGGTGGTGGGTNPDGQV